jgi:hypothetical protein
LKHVTSATMRPPIAPIVTSGIAAAGFPENRFHVNAAERIARASRMPVLFTAPWMVMRWSPTATDSLKVLGDNVGLDVRSMAEKIAARMRDATRTCRAPDVLVVTSACVRASGCTT